MIKNKIKSNNDNNFVADFVFFFLNMSILVLLSLFIYRDSRVISRAVGGGLRLCYTTIIPAVFPFMILGDLVLSLMHFEKIGFIKRMFSRLFKIRGHAVNAFIIGALCGFPIGVKIAKELYLSEVISKEECERLIGFSNHASPSFVISAIGISMRKSAVQGLALYLIPIFASFIAAFLFSIGKSSPREKSIKNTEISEIKFSLTDSVKSAAENTLSVCGFIVIFSVIISLLSSFVGDEAFMLFISPFLEIGNSCKLISESRILTERVSFILSAFAIAFSGFSVHLQSKSILTGTDISMKKYYIMKLFSAFLSVISAFFLFPIIS